MTTPADIFANITDRFNVEAAKNLDMTVAFNLTGDDGGEWMLKLLTVNAKL